MESMRAHFEREAASEGPWTGYNSSLSRPLLNSAKFLEKKAVAAAASSNAGTGASASSTESTLKVDSATEPLESSVAATTSDEAQVTAHPEKF
jgi:hypothetical protein